MIAMIFEVWPKSEHRQDYLDTAAVLRPLLDGRLNSSPAFVLIRSAGRVSSAMIP